MYIIDLSQPTEEIVFQILDRFKASYRKQEFQNAGLTEDQISAAITELAAQGRVKVNKAGAVSVAKNPKQDRRKVAMEKLSINNKSNGFN